MRSLAVLLLFAGAAPAAVIFSDNFDGNISGLNHDPIGWISSNGTVDVLVHGNFGLPCVGGAGLCVDLDGTTSDAAVLTSLTTFNLTAGNIYTLSYWLSGSQRGDTNTVTVSFGGVFQTHTLPSSAPYAQFSLVVTPAVDLSAQAVVFDHAGGDQLGLLLDSVSLNEGAGPSAVPEPGTALLLAGALTALGVLRKSRPCVE